MLGDECMRWCAVVVNAHLCEKFMLTYTVYKIYMYISLCVVYISRTCTHWLKSLLHCLLYFGIM